MVGVSTISKETGTAAGGLQHCFISGSADCGLLLLGRTGGNEMDLLDLGRHIAPGASLLGVRGNVLENGRPRFFRRVGTGNFDIEDLKLRVDELCTFIAWAHAAYGMSKPIGVGFSNGANILWPLLLWRPDVLGGAILMRPMRAFIPQNVAALNGLPVLVIAGRSDTVVPPERARETPDLLSTAGADVTLQWADAGHDFSMDDDRIAAHWLTRFAS